MEYRNQAFADKNLYLCQFNNKRHLSQCKFKYNDDTIKYKMVNILNYCATFYRFGSSKKQQQQQPLDAETLNLRVLMDCSNQQNLEKLKEIISLSVYKRNALVIIDKIVLLRRIFQKLWLSWPGFYCFFCYYFHE